MGSAGLDKTLTLDHESLALPRLSFPLSDLLRTFNQLCIAHMYQQPTYRERYVTGVLQPGEPSCQGRSILLMPESGIEPAGAAEHSCCIERTCS